MFHGLGSVFLRRIFVVVGSQVSDFVVDENVLQF